jgi:hypothetical protein
MFCGKGRTGAGGLRGLDEGIYFGWEVRVGIWKVRFCDGI